MRRHRPAVIASLLLAIVVGGITPAPARATPDDRDDNGDITIGDPALAARVETSAPNALVPVEVLTADSDGAEAAVRRVGGVITGGVAGEIVQASVRSDRMSELAAADTVEFLQSPRRVNRLPKDVIEFGPVTGQNVAVANASAWQAAGITGAVKVGIIDFFKLGLWNPAEQGAKPDLAHQFCRDTSGNSPAYCPISTSSNNNGNGEEHGIAVAEVVKDIAPGAELYIATVGTVSDMQAAIDWFAANGVSIITRSLGAAYDGPGDGTGPLDALVDYATTRGITWFNSAGNDALASYGRFTGGVDAAGYVDFDNGPGVDTALTISPENGCIGFDGIRWSDWGKPAANVSDYRVEVFTSVDAAPVVVDSDQRAGAPPLEAVDQFACTSGPITIRIRLTSNGGDPTPDVVELALFRGEIEAGRWQVAGSASKPVVDSKSPALVAVGAVDPPNGTGIGIYSSQGPTNDGRVKPDVSAPSCVSSSVYSAAQYGPGACFNGTSAASPTAAGIAALLSSRGLAGNGVHLATLVRHLVTDLGAPGPDNQFGSGVVTLPAPPTAPVDSRPAQYLPLGSPQRILDTRPSSLTAGAPVGPRPAFDLIDLAIPNVGTPVSAVAVSIASVDSRNASYIQALPTLNGRLGAFASLNVAFPGQVKPNFAIVPVGANGSISLYLPTGGNVVVDLMGTFTPAATSTVQAGRYIAIDPRRVLDTRAGSGPVPPDWAPHKPTAGESIRITDIPANAGAVVLNVTATDADLPGFLRAQPTGATGLATANGNFVPGADSGTLSIVPIGTDGTVSILTSASTHLVADLLGYITNSSATAGSNGLFMPVTPGRAYDSRTAPNTVHTTLTSRDIQLTGLGQPAVPAGASAVSINLAADAAVGPGYLTAYPSGSPLPGVSNLNYPSFSPISNAGMVRVSPTGGLGVFVNQTTHVIIDVNGYFTGPT